MKRSQKTDSDNLLTRFDAEESIMDYFDTDTATVRVNVELPAWMLKAVDKESSRRGVERQALLKMWVADRLDSLASKRKTSRRSR